MRITDAARQTGATTDQIRYLERKRYIKGRWTHVKSRRIRDYPDSELAKVELIVRYFNQGYRYDVAYRKAIDDLSQPRLL